MKAWNQTSETDYKRIAREDDESVSQGKVFKSAKARKLILRIHVWNIYNEVFLSEEHKSDPRESQVKRATNLLADLLRGQQHARSKVDMVFTNDIEFWESVVYNLREFEAAIGMPPQLSLHEVGNLDTKRTINVYTTTDKEMETEIDCFADPFTQASELMVEHRLPPDELDFIQGMIQHEMVDIVRDGVRDQRDKLKAIQYKIAVVEHLTLLGEVISGKYQKMKNTYEQSSNKSISMKTPTKTNSGTTNSNTPGSTNRTAMHFNKLIIDERRKLDALEKKISDAIKKAGKLDPSEYYGGKPRDDGSEFKCSQSGPQANSPAKVSTPFSGKSTPKTVSPRRASVSLRQILSETPTKQQTFVPFQSTPGSVNTTVSDDSSEENTFGMSQHEIEKMNLFKKSESDRLNLIAENRRLRDEVCKAGSQQMQRRHMLDGNNPDLHSIVSELNLWDCERDELDAQIDRLTGQKEALLVKLSKTAFAHKFDANGLKEGWEYIDHA
mmetsp:Transcript_2275/g.3488  ORF Transcript_2275/g.3488 Transcript_2275/m.3488 type:complete len:497 (+) Transcript_2275:93-1583(+)|eukprot:CAMPEP_0185036560 /NCGR_PEP_ID=MMETSP1103-20130426/29704_1 /TAXON_ID=36769 /ORGANISM="Paraphysomonas bandaiensis, Strain Caron Lab Isolate" /LENGTH=496 /DNA_ID=CAMNT_0027574135 /DNA_START=85 /DNA_END=1575 /DNA_ORIENTATION=-